MPFLLDADWVIEAMANRPVAAGTLRSLAPEGLAISWITVGEVYEGAFGFPDPERHLSAFRRFLSPLRVIGLDDGVMTRFADVRAQRRRRGQILPDFDILVGATALEHDLTVLTFNTRHLARIPGLRRYRSETDPE